MSIRFMCSIFLVFAYVAIIGQERLIQSSEFDHEISSIIEFSIPVISVDDLRKIQQKVLIFDVRGKNEFEISHIENAVHLLPYQMSNEKLETIDKENSTLILYCSVGYRSEKAGEKLKSMGFKKVYNLYGSIFEWANRGYPLVDAKGRKTKKLHVYNRSWSVWVTNPDIQKIW